MTSIARRGVKAHIPDWLRQDQSSGQNEASMPKYEDSVNDQLVWVNRKGYSITVEFNGRGTFCTQVSLHPTIPDECLGPWFRVASVRGSLA